MPALMEICRGIGNRSLRVHTVDSRTPSPFASALLFGYVANYIYDGDAPLAERRAQALSIDQDQLRELMGDADLRELLDHHGAIEETEEQLRSQCLVETYRGSHDGWGARSTAAAGGSATGRVAGAVRNAGGCADGGTFAQGGASAGNRDCGRETVRLRWRMPGGIGMRWVVVRCRRGCRRRFRRRCRRLWWI